MSWRASKKNHREWLSTERTRARRLAKLKRDGASAAKIASAKKYHAIAVKKVAEWEKKANPRQHPNDRAALAYIVLHHKDSRCTSYHSPTGGYASVGLQQAVDGGRSFVAATGGWTYISVDLLRGLVKMLDAARRPITITCVVNGAHRSGSKHYRGEAADIYPELNQREINAFVAAPGNQHYFDEDESHDHLWTGRGGP